MADELAKNATQTDARTIEITRIFDAPRELVFEAWTNPEYLVIWHAPRGCSLKFKKIDVRAQGTFHSCIQNPNFGDCWCVGVYEEIVRPERLVYTIALSDADGNEVDPAQVGHDPNWPRATLVSVTFEEYGNKTKLTLRQNVLEQLAKKTGAYPSWLEMLDRLNEWATTRTAASA